MMKEGTTKKAIGILALIFGIAVIIRPSLLATLVGIYLIIIGVSNLLG